MQWLAELIYEDVVNADGTHETAEGAVRNMVKQLIETGEPDGDFFCECGRLMKDIEHQLEDPEDGYTKQGGDFSGGFWHIRVRMIEDQLPLEREV